MPDATDNQSALTGLDDFKASAFCFRHPLASSLVDGTQGWLVYTATESAGAVGKAQGEALLSALAALENVMQHGPLETLTLYINSSGAHFREPTEGLFYLNEFLEALWDFRHRGIRIITRCDGWLYGGMAMALTTVSHEVQQGVHARIGLLGYRASMG